METQFSSSMKPRSRSGTVTEAQPSGRPRPRPHPHPIGTIAQSSSRSTAPERLTGACTNSEIPPSDVISSEYFDYRVPFPGGHTRRYRRSDGPVEYMVMHRYLQWHQYTNTAIEAETEGSCKEHGRFCSLMMGTRDESPPSQGQRRVRVQATEKFGGVSGGGAALHFTFYFEVCGHGGGTVEVVWTSLQHP